MNENSTLPETVEIPYGRKTIFLTLPRDSVTLTPDDPEPSTTPERFHDDLTDYLAEADLDLSHPVLVVADKTRLCGYPEYLPAAVAAINRQRGKDSPFPILIAYGTHPRQTDEESLKAYGSLYQTWPFIHHRCDDPDMFTEKGVTKASTPIRFRKDLLSASAIVTMGPICHHYFAGYGGGRKLIFPGCGEKRAIYKNHGLFLDRREGTLSLGCRPGNFDDNPLAADLFEIESHLPAHLAIHGIQDSKGNICEFIIGRGRSTYLEACRKHAHHFEISQEPFDTVVASCGGYPKDINFIQAHKAIHNSAAFVKDGGTLIIFAQCIDNIGSQTFLPWYDKGGFSGAFKALEKNYEGNGGTALAMMAKTQRIRIMLVSELESSLCTQLSVKKCAIDEVQSFLSLSRGITAWIPNASLLVRQMKTALST